MRREAARSGDGRDLGDRIPVDEKVMAKLDAWIKANVAIRCIVETRWSSAEWPRVKAILRELLLARIEMEHAPWWN